MCAKLFKVQSGCKAKGAVSRITVCHCTKVLVLVLVLPLYYEWSNALGQKRALVQLSSCKWLSFSAGINEVVYWKWHKTFVCAENMLTTCWMSTKRKSPIVYIYMYVLYVCLQSTLGSYRRWEWTNSLYSVCCYCCLFTLYCVFPCKCYCWLDWSMLLKWFHLFYSILVSSQWSIAITSNMLLNIFESYLGLG